MNLETLGSYLGLTFQQVQKYENGTNRVSASRLSETATILGVPIDYFFAELSDRNETGEVTERRERMEHPETLALIRLYYAMPESVREHFLGLVRAVAKLNLNV